jgi:hypothetical protein
MWHVLETGQVHTGFWWVNLGETDDLDGLGVDGRIRLKWSFKKWHREAWIGLIWLRIGTGGWRF